MNIYITQKYTYMTKYIHYHIKRLSNCLEVLTTGGNCPTSHTRPIDKEDKQNIQMICEFGSFNRLVMRAKELRT